MSFRVGTKKLVLLNASQRLIGSIECLAARLFNLKLMTVNQTSLGLFILTCFYSNCKLKLPVYFLRTTSITFQVFCLKVYFVMQHRTFPAHIQSFIKEKVKSSRCINGQVFSVCGQLMKTLEGCGN